MAYFTVNDALDLLQTQPSNNTSAYIRRYAGILHDDSVKEKRKKIAQLLSAANTALANRDYYANTAARNVFDREMSVTKWVRPWNVAKALRGVRAPEGDHLIGVEIEMGFSTLEESRRVAGEVIKWRNVALDYEGGTYPIEATFPPIPAKKLTTQSKVGRYMKLLNESRVVSHDPNRSVGTHINVSNSRNSPVSSLRCERMNNIMAYDLSDEEKEKYFGRSRVYGWMHVRQDNSNNTPFVECKMFNSTTNWKQLKRYVNVATALYDLLVGSEELTIEVIRATLEAAHAKRV